MGLDLALEVFPDSEGAERAYADVRDAIGDAPWIDEIALVEHHRRDRIVVRGTFAGRYVDVDDQGDVIGKRTAEGALTGVSWARSLVRQGSRWGSSAAGSSAAWRSRGSRSFMGRSSTRSAPTCLRDPQR